MANRFFRGRDVSPMQSFVRFLKESDGILILDKTALQYIHDHDAVSNQRVMATRLVCSYLIITHWFSMSIIMLRYTLSANA